MGGKVTVPDIRARKGGQKLTMMTAYDVPTAKIVSEAGADMILVGDSLSNVVLGYDSTLQIDLDVMIHHTAAVARAKPDPLLVGDMPWMSYHVSIEDAVENAGRMVREGGAEAVKLEGGRKRLPVIEAILQTEIPVMGHIGLTPQSVHSMGGYRVQGKSVDDAREMIIDAIALAETGVFSIVLEGVPDVLAKIITEEISVPTIGIGAGVGTDGQVLVFHDVLGMHDGKLPKFVRQYADLKGQAVDALKQFFSDVQAGTFPAEEETYHMNEEVEKELLEGPSSDLSWPLSW